jgi:hypothetical protein
MGLLCSHPHRTAVRIKRDSLCNALNLAHNIYFKMLAILQSWDSIIVQSVHRLLLQFLHDLKYFCTIVYLLFIYLVIWGLKIGLMQAGALP